MREYKVKCYDTYLKEMILPEQLTVEITKGKLGHIEINDGDGGTSISCGKYLDTKRYILMRYTGYKDCNNQEIYEYDLWEREGFVGVVNFKYGQWQFTKHRSSNSYQYPYFHSNAKTGKIIGNIFKTGKE